MARITSVLVLLLAAFNLSTALSVPKAEPIPVPATDFDVIVGGGGPAGLSALSALCRVNRKVALFDTLEYRNNKTRNMHDVIGNDGAVPSAFRAEARRQIGLYELATFIERKVEHITYEDVNERRIFTVHVPGKETEETEYTARRVIMGTGVTDVLPDVEGVWDAYGKGLYWCPWCDGFEHRDQKLAIWGNLTDARSAVVEMHNINPDTVVLTDGSNTKERQELARKAAPHYLEEFAAYNVEIIDNRVTWIERLRDGAKPCPETKTHPNSQQQVINHPSNGAGPNGKHCDLFRIHFEGRDPIEREAILVNVATKQTSHLPAKLGLQMDVKPDAVKIVVGPKLNTSIDGLYAIGDCNNEGSTNVPHAMNNGKKAGVITHVAIAKEDSLANIGVVKRSLPVFDENIIMRDIGNSMEDLWESVKARFDS